MSRADDRRTEQLAFDADAQTAARPEEAAERVEPNPASWQSRCPGARDGQHRRATVEPDGRWRCQWCWHVFDPPQAFAHVTWTLCQAQLDLAQPIGVQRRRGSTPLFVYRCPTCQAIHRRPAARYEGREPRPAQGRFVCGKQVAKQGAA